MCLTLPELEGAFDINAINSLPIDLRTAPTPIISQPATYLGQALFLLISGCDGLISS